MTTGRQFTSEYDRAALVAPVNTSFFLATPVVDAQVGPVFVNQTARRLQVLKAIATVSTAPTGAHIEVILTVGDNDSVVEVNTDNLKIPATKKISNTLTQTADSIYLEPGQYLKAKVAVVGSTVAGKDLNVQVILR